MRPSCLAVCAIAFAGCGDDGAGPVDATGSDVAEVDASPDAAEPRSVTARVRQLTAAVEGANVVAHDAAGMPTATAMTDASGRATVLVPPSGAITVLVVSGTSRVDITTVIEPAAGELDVFVVPVLPNGNSFVTTSPAAVENATEHRVTTGCSNVFGTAPYNAYFAPRCIRNDSFDVLATARDVNAALIAWTAALDVPTTATGSLNLPAWETTVTSQTLQLTGVPAGLTLRARASYLFDDVAHVAWPSRTPPLTAGTATLSLDAPGAPLSPPMWITAYQDLGAATGDAYRWLMAYGSLPQLPSEIAIGDAMYPAIDDVTLDRSDAASPVATWQASNTERADGGAVLVSWSRDGAAYVWTVTFPPDRPSPLRFPALPPALATYGPTAIDAGDEVELLLLDVDGRSGWGDFAAHSARWTFTHWYEELTADAPAFVLRGAQRRRSIAN